MGSEFKNLIFDLPLAITLPKIFCHIIFVTAVFVLHAASDRRCTATTINRLKEVFPRSFVNYTY